VRISKRTVEVTAEGDRRHAPNGLSPCSSAGRVRRNVTQVDLDWRAQPTASIISTSVVGVMSFCFSPLSPLA